MNANDLIIAVLREKSRGWQGSDIFREGELYLERIAKHFLACEDCANEFDLQGGFDGTLQDFADYCANLPIEGWICEE